MPGTPHKNDPGRSDHTVIKIPLKGLFLDGIWQCNCTPRLPAAHFLVRKEGSNKGRWFYTCQKPKEVSCGFFLWDEKAVGREMKAVMSNSRSEPGVALDPTDNESSDDLRTVQGHIEASNRWMANLAKKEEDEFGDWPLSVNDEISLAGATKETALMKTQVQDPQTPRKMVRPDVFTTPGSKRKRDETGALPTPNTSRVHSDDVFTTSPSTRLKGGMWDGNEISGLMSPLVTPTPARFRDRSQTLEATESVSELKDYDITIEVMDLLKDQSLGEETATKVRQLLNTLALRTQGIARGRDITRMSLRTKESKIAELEQRIVELQNERELDKVIIKRFKSDMAQSISKNSRSKGIEK